MIEEKIFEKRSLLYQENAKVAAIFWEWRHKVMTSVFTAIVALFALSGWFYQQQLGEAVAIPLFFGFILSLIAVFLDWRNAKILQECYRVGEEIEDKFKVEDGVFKSIGKAHKKDNIQGARQSFSLKGIQRLLKRLLTYTIILRIGYILIAGLLLYLSIKAFNNPVKPSPQQPNADAATIEKISKCLGKTD